MALVLGTVLVSAVGWGRVGLGRTVAKLGRAVLGNRVLLVAGIGRVVGFRRLACGMRLAGMTATRTVPVLVLGRVEDGGTRVGVVGRTGGRTVFAGIGRGLLAAFGIGRTGGRVG